MMSAPNIYNFKDIHLYLEDCYKWQKIIDASFSVRKWAHELDIKADVLTAILKQKKSVTLPLVNNFAKNLNFDSSERNYFEAMMKYAGAPTTHEKRMFELVLAEFRGMQGSQASVKDQSIFSHWVYMAILAMPALNNFSCNKESIKSILMNDVHPDFIERAITRLLDLKLLELSTDGSLVNTKNHTTTKNDEPQEAIHRYYEQVSDLSKIGIKTPVDEREFQCFTLPIDEEHLPLFKETIRQFRAKVASISSGQNCNRVYQVNLQFFPLTKRANDLIGDKSSDLIHSTLEG